MAEEKKIENAVYEYDVLEESILKLNLFCDCNTIVCDEWCTV